MELYELLGSSGNTKNKILFQIHQVELKLKLVGQGFNLYARLNVFSFFQSKEGNVINCYWLIFNINK